jgi:hypothetical protein
MGRQSRIKAKRRELRSYVETRAITPAEANEAMRRFKGRQPAPFIAGPNDTVMVRSDK